MMPQLEENSQAFQDGETNLKQHVHKMDTTPTRARPGWCLNQNIYQQQKYISKTLE